MIKVLYGKDSKGNVKQWTVETKKDTVIVTHGRIGGKMQSKTTVCKPKNVGRANATTAEEQAILEATSKVNKQLDKLYRYTIEELDEVGNSLPMLAHDYTKVGHRMVYPLFVSRKLDGVRCIVRVTDGETTFTSRGGKPYLVPGHLHKDLQDLRVMMKKDELILDGEVYCHGMPLPFIISAIKKPNTLTSQLEFHIFDMPNEFPWDIRKRQLECIPIWEGCHLDVVDNYLVKDENEARSYLATFMEEGYEGVMLRSVHGAYQFNHRSSDLMKWKIMNDLEAKVEFVEKDKNGEGVLHVIMTDAKTRFKVKMRGSHEERLYENQCKLVGKWVNVRYQQLTPYGVPQFPTGVSVRVCDSKGNPLE